MTNTIKKATIRKDLQRSKVGVPIWKGDKIKYLVSGSPFEYRTISRWFQIKAFGRWWNAHTIDWDY